MYHWSAKYISTLVRSIGKKKDFPHGNHEASWDNGASLFRHTCGPRTGTVPYLVYLGLHWGLVDFPIDLSPQPRLRYACGTYLPSLQHLPIYSLSGELRRDRVILFSSAYFLSYFSPSFLPYMSVYIYMSLTISLFICLTLSIYLYLHLWLISCFFSFINPRLKMRVSQKKYR